MKQLIVGADGSEGGATAMRWAAQLAGRADADVVAVACVDPSGTGSAAGPAELVREHERRLATWLDEAGLADSSVRRVVELGDPREILLAVADREDADLLVVGRMGRSSGPGLLHTGSVAEYLAHHSTRPLAVIGGTINLPIRSALVGVDGSEDSRAALRWIRDLAVNAELRVVVASVAQPRPEWTPAVSPQNWRRGLETTIQEDYAAELAGSGVDFEVLALDGANPALALLEAAKREGPDLVVVGMRGVGGFTGLRVGGVALKTLHNADRPVVLVT